MSTNTVETVDVIDFIILNNDISVLKFITMFFNKARKRVDVSEYIVNGSFIHAIIDVCLVYHL